jgi:hypothetical protein
VVREEGDVEAELARTQVDGLLLWSQEIHQQGGPANLVKRARHSSIARTVATAATAVCKEHNTAHIIRSLIGEGKITVQHDAGGRHANALSDDVVAAHVTSLVWTIDLPASGLSIPFDRPVVGGFEPLLAPTADYEDTRAMAKKPLKCRLFLHDWRQQHNDQGQRYEVCDRCGAYRDRGSDNVGAAS